jgi:hypothetical protein
LVPAMQSIRMSFGSPNSIERLVADAVDAGNVHLEEAGTEELKTLLARLERSVLLVKRALEQIGTPND